MPTILHRLVHEEEGFSLIELMAVLAVIAVIAAFAVPKLVGAVSTAKRGADKAALRAIAVAVEEYYADRGQYPTSTMDSLQVRTALAPYLKSTVTWTNSSNEGFVYMATPNGTAYVLIDPQGQTGDLADTQVRVTCRGDDGNTYSHSGVWAKGANATLNVSPGDEQRMNGCAVANGRIYLLAYDR